MSEVQQETQESTELKSQYAAQVAADLERNAKEQDRLGGEVAALQAQLQALQQDQALLVSVQQALGSKSPAVEAVEEAAAAATVPAPRKAPAAKTARQKKAAASKPKAKKATTAKKATAKKAAPEKAAPEKAVAEDAAAEKPQPAAAAQPTLGALIHEHLSGQSEPRSAAEVTTALAQSHPERAAKTTVVRTTLEGLVAKGRVERTKQGTAVFYTAAGTAADSSEPESAGE